MSTRCTTTTHILPLASTPSDINLLVFKTPMRHNPLEKTIACLCKSTGIQGFKTNHSLRATDEQSEVDEQLVMEKTGHRSRQGVRSYKRTSDSPERSSVGHPEQKQGGQGCGGGTSGFTFE